SRRFTLTSTSGTSGLTLRWNSRKSSTYLSNTPRWNLTSALTLTAAQATNTTKGFLTDVPNRQWIGWSRTESIAAGWLAAVMARRSLSMAVQMASSAAKKTISSTGAASLSLQNF